MNNEFVRLSNRAYNDLAKELLNRQPLSDVEPGCSAGQVLWLDPLSRNEYLRSRRLARLRRLDELRESGFKMHMVPRVAASESDYIEIKGKDFNLEIQALHEDQQLTEDDASWILTLELSEGLSSYLKSSDTVQLLDNQGRVWLRLPFNIDRVYICTWQQNDSPIGLLGSVRLHLQIV